MRLQEYFKIWEDFLLGRNEVPFGKVFLISEFEIDSTEIGSLI